MKQIFFFLLILGVLGLFGIYSIVPKKNNVSVSLKMKVNSWTAGRLLNNRTIWTDVFKDSAKQQSINNDEFRYDEHTYQIGKVVLNTAGILIATPERKYPSLLQIIALSQDSSIIEWKTEVNSGFNPLTRIESHQDAKQLKAEFGELLKNMRKLLENGENAYGVKIEHTKVVDTLLISKKIMFDHYPTTAEIYQVVNDLKNYIARHHINQTNPAMLNIKSIDADYQMMVALPIEHEIPENDEFKIKIMVPGNILVTEVKGGTATTAEALHSLETYLQDKSLSSPAIPFESLITDRSQEPDTSKWITKVYYPIY